MSARSFVPSHTFANLGINAHKNISQPLLGSPGCAGRRPAAPHRQRRHLPLQRPVACTPAPGGWGVLGFGGPCNRLQEMDNRAWAGGDSRVGHQEVLFCYFLLLP